MPTSPDPLQPGFMLLQGNMLEDLRDLLVMWIRQQPLGPLEQEVILVQSNGVAQWLKMALAEDEGCGIAAAIQVDLPGRFLWQAYRSAFPDLPPQSPFDKQPLTWRIYRLLEALQHQPAVDPGLDILLGFLQQDNDPRRRHQLALRLADLYDQYQVYRADWLQHWADGREQLTDHRGQVQALPDGQRWQARLWQLLREDMDEDANPEELGHASRAQVHQAFVQRCASQSSATRLHGLPRRVVVFGISSLPRQTLEVLQAIAPFTQIMVFANNPCRHYWGDLISGKDQLRHQYRRIRARKLAPDASLAQLQEQGHPLLAAWGKQGRDYLHLLDEIDQPDAYRPHFKSLNQGIDLFRDPGEQSLLQQLQSDILELRPLTERRARPNTINPAQDNSLQFMVAHSPQREVEILHDQLLDAFEQAQRSGSKLEPRDVLVMVPDINVYAPHIEAVFGRFTAQEGPHDPRYLPFHICDQAQRGRNTLLLALEKLLHLPASRFAVSELLDLLDTPALRQRYRISDADLPRLRQWIQGANIRWGLDAIQRARLGMPDDLEQNTWRFGLRRMLLGFAAGDAPAWRGIEPYAEVSGLEAAMVGPLTLLLNDLADTLEQLEIAQPAAQWPELLNVLLARFFVATDRADSWALSAVQHQLEVLQEAWSQSNIEQHPLPLDVVRDALLDALDRPTLSQRFLGGSINFATLMPMRAIPFRQIWLLGMNDSDYPRPVQRADFDLMARDYRPGDRSRREDDRYLFLEALLAARQRLVISWVGRNIRDNSPRPPSVVVAQLRDHLAAAWCLEDATGDEQQQGDQLLAALTTEHPLQPFSHRYFLPTRDARLFTYASEWRRMHDARPEEDNHEMPPFTPPESIGLTHLARFLRQPVQSFYAWRLRVDGFDEQALIDDDEGFSLDGLHTWSLQQQMIESLQQSLADTPDLDIEQTLAQLTRRIQGRGELPLPPFDTAHQQRLAANLLQPLLRYQQLLAQYPQRQAPAQREWALADNLRLQASMNDIFCDGAGAYQRFILQPSKLHQGKSYKWHQVVRYWPAHLLAQTIQPCSTLLLGPDSEICLPALSSDSAEDLLLDLAAAWLQSMQSLPPLACRTAFAALLGDKPEQVYEGNERITGEIDDHPAFARYWPDYATLSAEPAFSALSERLYDPLFSCLNAAMEAQP